MELGQKRLVYWVRYYLAGKYYERCYAKCLYIVDPFVEDESDNLYEPPTYGCWIAGWEDKWE